MRLALLIATVAALLLAPLAPAPRLVRFTILTDGDRVALVGTTSDEGRAGIATQWRYLSRVVFQPAKGVTVPADGLLRDAILRLGATAGPQTAPTDLRLVKVDTGWRVPSGEIERTATMMNLGPPAPPRRENPLALPVIALAVLAGMGLGAFLLSRRYAREAAEE